jgi:deoxyribose-phosphate aldolase
MNPLSPAQIAAMIDHTLLKPEAAPQQVAQLCTEAREFGFASVCVNPAYVALCAEWMRGSPVKVGSAIGFPLGASLGAVKAFEAEESLRLGAQELDMVIAVGALKAGNLALVQEEIATVTRIGHAAGAIVKVIFETCLLTEDEKITCCRLCSEAGADFVKTSTGFSSGGATPADVALMRRCVGPVMGVKASGGIRSLADLHRMVAAGATRIGTSAGVMIVREVLAAEES